MDKYIEKINFALKGFGFENIFDFKISLFGWITVTTLKSSGIIATVMLFIQNAFGFNHKFLVAYVLLIIVEWGTGILASYERGEVHESRKLGRMLLKIAVYSLLIYIPNTFQKESIFPKIQGYELDPFLWLYWIVLFVIIWQLFISILENLSSLNFKFAKVLIKIINKKVKDKLDIEDEDTKP